MSDIELSSKISTNKFDLNSENSISQFEIEESKKNSLDIKFCVKSQFFKYLFLICILFYISISFFILNGKLLYLSKIEDDHFASYAIILQGFSVIVGRIVFGYLYDKMNFYWLCRLLIITNITSSLIFYFFGNDYFMISLMIFLINMTGNY